MLVEGHRRELVQSRVRIEGHFAEQRLARDLVKIDPNEVEAAAQLFRGLSETCQRGWFVDLTIVDGVTQAERKALPLTVEDRPLMRMLTVGIDLDILGPPTENEELVVDGKRANVAHMGDLMFNKRHPFVDRSAGANMSNWINVLDKAVREFERDTIYIFGHSLNPGEETGTAEDLKKFGGYLAAILQFAEKEFKAGKSKEEFIKNTSIPGVTEWSGDGIQRPLTAAYEEVSTK